MLVDAIVAAQKRMSRCKMKRLQAKSGRAVSNMQKVVPKKVAPKKTFWENGLEAARFFCHEALDGRGVHITIQMMMLCWMFIVSHNGLQFYTVNVSNERTRKTIYG